MHVLIVDRDTLAILAIDPAKDINGQPILPEGHPRVKVIEVTDPQYAVVTNAINAQFTVADDGTITATEIPPEPPTEGELARTDLKTTAQAAIDQIDQFLAITTPNNAQVVAAVRGLAQNQKRLIRFIRANT